MDLNRTGIPQVDSKEEQMTIVRVMATAVLAVCVSSPLAAQATGSVRGRVLDKEIHATHRGCVGRDRRRQRSVGRTDWQQRHLYRSLDTGGASSRACVTPRLRTRYHPRRRPVEW